LVRGLILAHLKEVDCSKQIAQLLKAIGSMIKGPERVLAAEAEDLFALLSQAHASGVKSQSEETRQKI